MMSKERELLKRWLAGEANQIPTHVPLLIETQNLLAQPEALAPEREFIRLWYENIELWKVHAKEPEQEPVAWMWTRNYEGGGYTNKVFEFLNDAEEYAKDSKTLKSPDIIRPLYTAPPKREPLSDEEIYEIFSKNEWNKFIELARAIEKAHGIGGGE
jgi:hypothetical protein